MSIRNRGTKIVEMPKNGINLNDSLEDVKSGEAILTQNCYFRKGLKKRYGSQQHPSTGTPAEIVSSKKVVGLHRFYHDNQGRKLVGVCGTNISVMDDSTGAWTAKDTGQTDSTTTHMVTWGAINRLYIANGVDVPIEMDNSYGVADMGNAPSKSYMFLPYRDRLLSCDRNDVGYIRWSDSYSIGGWTSTAEAIRVPGSADIEVMSLHSLAETDTGVDAMVFIANATSIYLFSGTNLAIGASLNARLDPIGGGSSVGCVSARTVIATPKGTIFLGSDRQVYLLPFGTSKIHAIGHKIQSLGATKGIEDIPDAQLALACAKYHNGFYKLAFSTSGQTANNTQFWLDVDRLQADDKGHIAPWFGPMTGNSISMFVHQNGSGDNNLLVGGEAGATGFVYDINNSSLYADTGTAISMIYQSPHESFSQDPTRDSRIMETEIEVTDHDSTITMAWEDTNGSISTSSSITAGTIAIKWGDDTWGDDFWAGTSGPVRRKIELYDKFVTGRFISTTISYSSSDDFNFFGMAHNFTTPRASMLLKP